MAALPHWLNVVLFSVYAVGVFWAVRTITKRHLPGSVRKPLLYALGLGAPILTAVFSREAGGTVTAAIIVAVVASIFAILLTPEQETSGASQ